jgi:hypothetical protein
MPQYRRVMVALSADEYRVLAHLAERETRALDQQVTHIVRQFLANEGATDAPRLAQEKTPTSVTS